MIIKNSTDKTLVINLGLNEEGALLQFTLQPGVIYENDLFKGGCTIVGVKDRKDKLDEVVALQRTIAARFHNLEAMTVEEKEKATQEYLTAIVAEVGEILNGDDINGIKGQGAIRWKSWKKNVLPPDPNYVKTELIDILHFTLEMLLIWGCDADEIYRRYVGKNQENLARYNSNY